MPKYRGKQIFSLGSFPRIGSKAKDGEKERTMVMMMASYALQRNLGLRTQAAWAKRKKSESW